MTSQGMTTVRSYLYVPADNADRLGKSVGRGADAVIADLEDGVAPDRKEAARRVFAQWLATAGEAPDSVGEAPDGASGVPAVTGPQRWVRMDPNAAGPDISAAASPALTGVMVAKADAGVLAEIDRLLTRAEAGLGLPNGHFAVIPLIESAAALLDVAAVARAPRVLRLGIGEVDLAADLGLRPGPDAAELAPLRFQVVAASAAAGIARPLGPTSTDFRDLEAFKTTGEQLLRQGFRARTAIHPAQISVIHAVFTPSREELAAARDLLDRFAAAHGGVAVDARGRMIDAAVVRSARETVDTAWL